MKEKGGAVYQLFLLALSIYVLIVVFFETFLITDPEVSLILQRIDLCICFVFLGDFFVNLYHANNKISYLKWGWIDLLSSIPLVDPFRWGRLARIVRILRFIRTIKSLKLLVSSIQASKFQSLTFVVILITFVAYTVCASLILELESSYEGGINTANEALWWAFLNIMNAKVSITQAQSTGGMVATVVLNKIGLLLFAYFNAMIIAWLIQKRVSINQNLDANNT
ncbi:voltage-gated potassium channel [Amphritea atlantica]|uniref:Voltage-gated potassium channel n=1 Tax=Amphritea atlantica TaxID=355243 RepID=A0A1H9MBX9_9GAMM|nr:ion transporter [Amphritea atlantica]SER21198.1 voltage-gated potassium channel [Amphritea atlantica]